MYRTPCKNEMSFVESNYLEYKFIMLQINYLNIKKSKIKCIVVLNSKPDIALHF